MKKLIMCDLDNTLVPLYTQEKFVDIWFRDIMNVFRAHGLDPSAGLYAMNDGCRAMVFNQGQKTNMDVFFDVACAKSGFSRAQIAEVLDDYYGEPFENVRTIARENPYAPGIVRLMRAKAAHVVLATMPMFPLEACHRRLRWVGLSAEMFDLVTTCDFSSFCKPNPNYYAEILKRFGAKPEDALMIGNDVREDMEPCEYLGIDTFLVTEHILTHGLDYARFRQGSYADLIRYLEEL